MPAGYLVVLRGSHLFRHCARVVPQDGMYQCFYSRCSGRLHSSLEALKMHVELSHLSRVPLSCLARGCSDVFVRLQQLQTHLEQAHRELLRKNVSIDALAPLATLATPRGLRPPPQLPYKPALSSLFLASISIPPIHLGQSQASASQGLSRKWSRLNVQDEENSEDHLIQFDNLQPALVDKPKLQLVDIEIRRKQPLARQPLLSRPQSVISNPRVPYDGDKQTILYPAFVRMVDDLVARGTLSGENIGGM